MQGSSKWKTFLFPPLSEIPAFEGATQQYFGLDLIIEDNERTHWTHKPGVWENLFAGNIEMAKANKAAPISDVFDEFLSCALRTVPNGPNDTKSFKSVNNANIQHWIMLVPMPTDTS